MDFQTPQGVDGQTALEKGEGQTPWGIANSFANLFADSPTIAGDGSLANSPKLAVAEAGEREFANTIGDAHAIARTV